MSITYQVTVEENGSQVWYLDDKRHRLDGPAVIYADGTQNGDQYWYLDGVKMSQEEHAARTAPVKELTVGEIESLLGHKVKIVK